MEELSKLINTNVAERDQRESNRYNPAQIYDSEYLSTSHLESEAQRRTKPHLFSVFATRHNTHINVSKPYEWDAKKSTKENEENEKKHPYNVMMTLSAGNLGFRHSARKHYDSAFQVAAVVMERMQARGLNEGIRRLEVHLRGFGAGREAVTKALLGSEGRLLRHKIVKVADNTRLKFGGTRSKKPRRLG
jgi:small subunit ribosomal protein S11